MNSQVEIEDQTVKEKAWKVCKDFLQGPWAKISLEEFRFFEVRGGLSNKLYRCALSENAARDSGVPKEVLLRIYGFFQEDPNIVVTEAVTFMLLSERRLGPKLYGVFPGGRLEEFIPSRCINTDEMRSYALLTAREMAKIHALDVPVRKVPEILLKYSTNWLHEAKDVLESDKGEHFMSFNEYAEEIRWLTTEMAKTNSPVVYCHNDLQGGNILYREDTTQKGNPKLVLIDFEFGAYNYRGYDIANHFCEWCIEYSVPEFPHFRANFNNFPSRQEQIEFLTVYLDQLSKEGVPIKRPLKEEIESMLSEVRMFSCCAQLIPGLWSAKMAPAPNWEFSHREHGKTRKIFYKKFKEQYLASMLKTNNNDS